MEGAVGGDRARRRLLVVRRRYPLAHAHGAQPLAAAGALDPDSLAMLARARAPRPRRARLLYLDTETTGLAGGTGTYVFLVGAGFVDGDEFEVRQYFMRDLDEEPALLAALEGLLARLRGLRHLQRHRLRPAAPRDAVRPGPAALAGRSLPPRPARLRATPLARAASRLPAGHRGAERPPLPPDGRPARRPHPRRLLRLSPPQAAGRAAAGVRAQSPRHPLPRRADRLGGGGGDAGARRRRRARRAGRAGAPLGGARRRAGGGLLPSRPSRAASPARAAPACSRGWPGGRSGAPGGPEARALWDELARAQRVFDPRPWEEMAKIDEHRLRDWSGAQRS